MPLGERTSEDVESLEEKQGQACPAALISQALQNTADEDPKNTYSYSPFTRQGSIRLLRLIPADENAGLECQLFNYPLQETRHRACLYEALSYVWGSSDKPKSISIGKCHLPVTANLYTALLHLRDPRIERILWIDAICINQEDLQERSQQVQYMANIYCKANRVIVWLGEAAADSDQALRDIRLAADESEGASHNEGASHHAILTLLQRDWFKRIWVRSQTPRSC
jgi:hypothetical protein